MTAKEEINGSHYNYAAIDPGTEYTRIYRAGKGLVPPERPSARFRESSEVCDEPRLWSFGQGAGKMTAFHPISDGVIE